MTTLTRQNDIQSISCPDCVGKALDGFSVGNLLRRVRDTPPQARLDAAGRERNVQGAFLARRIEGQRLLLFDDVHTTGATLVAAQDALFDAGASTVISLSLAGRS